MPSIPKKTTALVLDNPPKPQIDWKPQTDLLKFKRSGSENRSAHIDAARPIARMRFILLPGVTITTVSATASILKILGIANRSILKPASSVNS